MFERLLVQAGESANRRAEQKGDQLISQAQLPPGVAAEAIDGGVRLTGTRLRRRLIADPQLRNFGR